MSSQNETILKLVAELKASAIDGISINVSEKPDGSVSVVFCRPSAENVLDPPTEIDCVGNKFWKNKGGLRHRDGDLPAVIYADGSKVYYKNGKLHRDGDLPAIEHADGTKYYYKNDLFHRDGGKPAVISQYKYQYWLDGKLILTVNHKNGVVEI